VTSLEFEKTKNEKKEDVKHEVKARFVVKK
jgi:hypothetical protein